MSDAVRTRASVRAAYERIASAYDERIPGGSPADDLFTDSERAFVLGRIGPDDEVLDVGCGTGRLAVPVATRARAVHGLDLTPAMIRVAAENARRAGVQVILHEADMRHLPFPDQRFDVAMSHLALMHVDRSERPAVFAELSRVLRPGGRLLIGVKNRLFERMTGIDRFASVDVTDVEREELVFTRANADGDGDGELRAPWHSFSPEEIVRLCATVGLSVTTTRGNIPLAAWLDDRVLADPGVSAAVRALEGVLAEIPPLNMLGYHLLVEAVKPQQPS